MEIGGGSGGTVVGILLLVVVPASRLMVFPSLLPLLVVVGGNLGVLLFEVAVLDGVELVLLSASFLDLSDRGWGGFCGCFSRCCATSGLATGCGGGGGGGGGG